GIRDRNVTGVQTCALPISGKVAKQQATGPLHLPLNNCGVMALDYNGKEGIATSVGHSPLTALIDPEAGSRNAITESLTNIIWARSEERRVGKECKFRRYSE